MKFQSNAIFNGTITANSVADAGTNTDKFLVLNSSGLVTYRTAAELYADLGIGSAAAGYTGTVKHAVKAGVAVNKGQAVYVTSADGTNMIVGKASNDAEATSSKTMGLIETTLALNGIGNVITEGLLAGLDTTGANAAGDPVWLGTNGNLIYGVANKPYAPAHMVFIGIVTRINANNGEIFVKVQNGFELEELHNVDLKTTTPINGHILGYDGTLWVNKTIAGWLGFTPVTDARTLTINGTTYDLSANRTWTISSGVSGTANYVPVFTDSTTIGNSNIYKSGSLVGINTTSPNSPLHVYNSASSGDTTAAIALDTVLANNAVDIRFGSSNPVAIRIYAASSALTSTPSGAGFQAFSNSSASFPGQIYFDSGANNSAALIFRTAPSSGTITTRMRIESNGTIKLSSYTSNGFVKTSSSDGTITIDTTSYTPTSRTITINGTSYDLSADRSWSINSMVYPSAGIAVSTGTAWGTSITDNSTNWNAAYTYRITDSSFPLSITSNVISISQATNTSNGYLTSTDWITFNSKQGTITLTTTGSSGSATFTANTLNIPTYTLSGLGGVPSTRTITINGTTYDLSADRTWSIAAGVSSFNTRTGAITLLDTDVTGALGYTPVTNARTITINGTTYDLSANRSWTVDASAATTRTIQKYTADGSSATYTVTGGYTVGMVDVYVNGIKLDNASGVEFTATNGTTVVLTSTPASGDIVEVYKFGGQFIATNALRQTTLFTATAGQNTFTVNYSVGLVDVYYNGSKLDSSEYTASTGTSIVLGTNCVVGDKVEVVAYTYNATGFTGVAYSGTPTTNYLTKWTSTGTIGNSIISDDGTTVIISGKLNFGTTGQMGVFGTSSTTDKYISINNSTGTFDLGTNSTSHYLQGNGALPMTFLTNATLRMSITSDGNVRIGNNTYNYRLSVYNSSDGTTAAFGGTAYGLRIDNGGTFSSGMTTLFGVDGSFYGSYQPLRLGASTLLFSIGTTEAMRITSSGNVGINTTSPSEKLEVNGNIKMSGTTYAGYYGSASFSWSGGTIYPTLYGSHPDRWVMLVNPHICYTQNGVNGYTGNTFGSMIRMASDSAVNYVWDMGILGTLGGDKWGIVRSNGTLASLTNGGTWSTSGGGTSDRRTKQNIEYITSNSTELIQKLNPVKFEFIDSPGKTRRGFIAQDVLEVIPDLVLGNGEIDGGTYGLDYDGILALAVKAIQEQQSQISAQAIEIDNLKKLIN